VSCSEAERILSARYGNGLQGGTPQLVTTVERVIDDRPCEPLLPEDCEHSEPAFPGSGLPLYEGWAGPGQPGFAEDRLDSDMPVPVDEDRVELSQFVERYLAQSSADPQHNERCSWYHGTQGAQLREFEALLPSLAGVGNGKRTTALTESVASMPSSWWQHLKWTLQRRWPRLFGWLTVYWTQSWRVK
jgi:hypothetical protein